jgi:hypothetical protein
LWFGIGMGQWNWMTRIENDCRWIVKDGWLRLVCGVCTG